MADVGLFTGFGGKGGLGGEEVQVSIVSDEGKPRFVYRVGIVYLQSARSPYFGYIIVAGNGKVEHACLFPLRYFGGGSGLQKNIDSAAGTDVAEFILRLQSVGQRDGVGGGCKGDFAGGSEGADKRSCSFIGCGAVIDAVDGFAAQGDIAVFR